MSERADGADAQVQRLQELQLMVARAREELRELENELHRQEGRVEVLLAHRRPAEGDHAEAPHPRRVA